VHIIAPNRPGSPYHIGFNVDRSVGAKGANSSTEDILLVQFMIRKIAETSAGSTPEQEMWKRRMLKAPVSGMVDDDTIDAIRAFQEATHAGSPGTIVDGRVDSARGHSYGSGFYTILYLNGEFRAKFQRAWPRLQDVDGCPPGLAAAVKRIL
jgi:hypothetical protein